MFRHFSSRGNGPGKGPGLSHSCYVYQRGIVQKRSWSQRPEQRGPRHPATSSSTNYALTFSPLPNFTSFQFVIPKVKLVLSQNVRVGTDKRRRTERQGGWPKKTGCPEGT